MPGIKEKLSHKEWFSLSITVTGIVLLAIFGPSPDGELDYAGMQESSHPHSSHHWDVTVHATQLPRLPAYKRSSLPPVQEAF